MNLLYIIASPRKQRSATIDVANAFINAWKKKNPEGKIDTLNVWEMDLLPFDGSALDAKYAVIEGKTMTAEQAAVWEQVAALGRRFHRADLILFGVPMWNSGIPYRLKHLIDVVSQKDILFTFDERGLLGMLGGRRAIVIAARGTARDPDDPHDFHTGYMAAWSRMVGITEFHSVSVERTLFGLGADAASREQARARAIALAEAL